MSVKTYIELKEVLVLLWGDLVVGSEGQIVNFHALSQVHALRRSNVTVIPR